MPVGVLLLIFSDVATSATPNIRCNVSSWYVEPAFRSFASLLVLRALKNKRRHLSEHLAGAGHARHHRGAGIHPLLQRPAPRAADAQRPVAGIIGAADRVDRAVR